MKTSAMIAKGFTVGAFFLLLLNSAGIAQTYSEPRNVDAFKAVVTGGSQDLYVKQGSTQSVRIEGDEDDVKDIETEVRNGILYIKFKDRWHRSHDRVTVYVTMKEINGLKLAGSGNIIGETPINTDELELGISGSGNIKLDVTAKEINSGISGSGNIRLSGTTTDHNFKISGSGDVNTLDLKAENCAIQISGAGDAKVYVSKKLDVKVSGSGSIRYAGDPDKVNTNVSGSGSVQKI
jgi:hypothetical protein